MTAAITLIHVNAQLAQSVSDSRMKARKSCRPLSATGFGSETEINQVQERSQKPRLTRFRRFRRSIDIHPDCAVARIVLAVPDVRETIKLSRKTMQGSRRQRTFGTFSILLSLVCISPINILAQGLSEPDFVHNGLVRNVTSNANVPLVYGMLNWVFQPVGGGAPITNTLSLTNINKQFSYLLRIRCETEVGGCGVLERAQTWGHTHSV